MTRKRKGWICVEKTKRLPIYVDQSSGGYWSVCSTIESLPTFFSEKDAKEYAGMRWSYGELVAVPATLTLEY